MVAQKSEVSKIVSILKSVRNEQLNEKNQHVFNGEFLDWGEVWNQSVYIYRSHSRSIIRQHVRRQGEEETN